MYRNGDNLNGIEPVSIDMDRKRYWRSFPVIFQTFCMNVLMCTVCQNKLSEQEKHEDSKVDNKQFDSKKFEL